MKKDIFYQSVGIGEKNIGPEKLQEYCGLVAVLLHHPSPKALAYVGTASVGVQHRGQDRSAICAYSTNGGIRRASHTGLVRELLVNKRKMNTLGSEALWALLHCRYGTDGDYSEKNTQPFVVHNPYLDIRLAIGHNGQIAQEPLRETVTGKIPHGVSDTYLLAHYLSQLSAQNQDELVLKALEKTKGAYAMIIATNDTLYAGKDEFDLRPLVIGALPDNEGYIIASETYALDKVNAPILRELQRGEVLRVNSDGIQTIREGLPGPGTSCSFEYAYFRHPNSRFPTHEVGFETDAPQNWPTIMDFRRQCGEQLGLEYPLDLDIVTGVPDSGLALATGYSEATQIPFRLLFTRDHYSVNGRTFLHSNLSEIAQMVKRRLMPIKSSLKGMKIGITDDSIVRGNVSRVLNEALWELEAAEIHWLVGFPQVKYPCHLGVSMRDPQTQIAHVAQGDNQEIARRINATAVHYISIEGFLKKLHLLEYAIQRPLDPDEIALVNHLCMGCVTGKYPISKEGIVYQFNHQT